MVVAAAAAAVVKRNREGTLALCGTAGGEMSGEENLKVTAPASILIVCLKISIIFK